MARKPNYDFERAARTKAKAAKREAKRQAKQAAKEKKAEAATEKDAEDSSDGGEGSADADPARRLPDALSRTLSTH